MGQSSIVLSLLHRVGSDSRLRLPLHRWSGHLASSHQFLCWFSPFNLVFGGCIFDRLLWTQTRRYSVSMLSLFWDNNIIFRRTWSDPSQQVLYTAQQTVLSNIFDTLCGDLGALRLYPPATDVQQLHFGELTPDIVDSKLTKPFYSLTNFSSTSSTVWLWQYSFTYWSRHPSQISTLTTLVVGPGALASGSWGIQANHNTPKYMMTCKWRHSRSFIYFKTIW